METENKKGGTGVIIGVVVVVLLVGGFVLWKLNSSSIPVTATPTPSPVTPTPTTMMTNPMPMMDNRKYKDGTYTAPGSYFSPAGDEKVNVSLTIKNDVVTDASFDATGLSPTSKNMQANFKAGFKQYVVGKSIDSISLTVVNGSSLTPKGFMNALAKIKTQAQA